MANFYSPQGNLEVWETKPNGYFTESEWMAAHPIPDPTPEELAARRIADIDARLAELDLESIRPLRAINEGAGTNEDAEKLAALEREAAVLRVERANLV